MCHFNKWKLIIVFLLEFCPSILLPNIFPSRCTCHLFVLILQWILNLSFFFTVLYFYLWFWIYVNILHTHDFHFSFLNIFLRIRWMFVTYSKRVVIFYSNFIWTIHGYIKIIFFYFENHKSINSTPNQPKDLLLLSM